MAKKRTSKPAPKSAAAKSAAKPAPKAAASAAKPVPKPAPKRDGLHMLIVEARYYLGIADELLSGAKKTLDEAGCTYDVVTVPGALEVPAAIAMAVSAAGAKPYDGAIALGCVIQGETYHFDIVSNESARGLMDLSIQREIPLGNGILTVDNEHQAKERLGGDHGHKGIDAARAALVMARLKRSLKGK
jgi:6,7-dimethyl-8-ribityllumazine synthase